MFTNDEIRLLENGVQVEKIDKSYSYLYFTRRTTEGPFIVYEIKNYNSSINSIRPNSNVDYAGIIYNSRFYNSNDYTEISEKLNDYVYTAASNTDFAESMFFNSNPDKWNVERIETIKEYDQVNEAGKLFYEGKKPELSPITFKLQPIDLFNYVLDPDKYIKETGLNYIEFNIYHILYARISYDNLLKAYNKIVDDPQHEAKKVKAIKEAIKDKKTVNVITTKGDKIKILTSAIYFHIPFSISNWYFVDPSHRYDHRTQKGYKDITINDISAITYSNKEIWKAS